jgi:DNA-binding HxlR family transcriptional regulator
MEKSLRFGCPIKATTDALRGKWKGMILWELTTGPVRFAALRDALPGVSEKVLTEQLRQLEMDGIVERKVSGDKPPRVEYALTAAGKELKPLLVAMCEWAGRNLGVVARRDEAA